MDQILNIKLEINRDGRIYEFIIRPGYEWNEIQDVLDELKAGVEHIRKEQEQQMKPIEEPIPAHADA